MTARVRKCAGCGAELGLGSDTCPLCGTEARARREPKAPPANTDAVVVDDYQSDLRRLREQLRRLRDNDARAV
jgi:predicted amidophosphoribosyltransferase